MNSAPAENHSPTIDISSAKFVGGCAIAGLFLFAVGWTHPFPSWVIASEVVATILSLFIFGSIRYRIDKNALTYGALLIIFSTFWGGWWPGSEARGWFQSGNYSAIAGFLAERLLTLHGLDQLIHADTMLFILGLTFFVSVIAQTRLLETVSFKVLLKNRGAVLPTVAIVTAIVALASGILDGVSMIGLMIRTLVIILFLAQADNEAVLYAVMVSTIVTTVCGMWLAYGEPPNLIMKANLYPHLTNGFFLRYCLPVAFGSYLIVLWNLRKKLHSVRVEIGNLDVLDFHTADVRFLQAERHGEVLTPIEFIEDHANLLEGCFEPVLKRLHRGEPLGSALIQESVPEKIRLEIMGKFLAENLAGPLDAHYSHHAGQDSEVVEQSEKTIRGIFKSISHQRVKSQWIGFFSFIPFIGLLICHGVNHHVPLYLASFAGFAVAVIGIFSISKMRRLAFNDAVQEYREYLFLFPLFFSITLLQKSGFFDQLSILLHHGIERFGVSHIAFIQFIGATFLSAILDNNIVADFSSRALHNLDLAVLYLFSMAQIAGYAAGGCWTHIGSAQSVVAYAFVQKDVDENFTPFQWIKAMTPVILQIILLLTVIVYGEGMLLRTMH